MRQQAAGNRKQATGNRQQATGNGLAFTVACCLVPLVCAVACCLVPVASRADEADPPERLSAYGLFRGNGSTQEPVDGVVPYDLNTPFFSDYATKYRFVRLPRGSAAKYHESDVFDFPVGTVIAKTFAYPVVPPSHRGGEGSGVRGERGKERLIETRLLVHRPEGWIGLPYAWNDEQTEATLQIVGGTRAVRWVRPDGREHTFNYIIPNVNQCMACHENDKVLRPLGPKARNLNKDFAYANGKENQLAHWGKVGHLHGAPQPEQAPRAPVWNDPMTGTLEQRARTWLDVNCAHCHSPRGPAKATGLDLQLSQTDPYKLGLWKTPVAAGPATGGRSYDIVPGRPEESILIYRLQSMEPAIMMPELTRRLVDEEGVALIREWLAGLKAQPVPAPAP